MASGSGFNEAQAVQAACIAMEEANATGAIIARGPGFELFEGQVLAFVSRFSLSGASGEDLVAWLLAHGTSGADLLEQTARFLVDFKLMERAALERGIVVLSGEVHEHVRPMAERFGGLNGLVDELEARGMTLAQFREGVRANLVRRRLVEDVAVGRVEGSDDLDALLLLKGSGALGKRAAISDAPPEMMRSARDEADRRLEREAFDKWFSQYREQAGVAWRGARAGAGQD